MEHLHVVLCRGLIRTRLIGARCLLPLLVAQRLRHRFPLRNVSRPLITAQKQQTQQRSRGTSSSMDQQQQQQQPAPSVPPPEFLDPSVLARWIKERGSGGGGGAGGSSFAVVDVRDDDEVLGGNIPGARHIVARTVADKPESVVQTLGAVDNVVFHCRLSQVRGPRSAIAYKRALAAQGEIDKQQVWILRGGFERWQALYRADKDLTENYDEELWKDYH
ncbi:Rhodanese-like domain-containing protein [Zopfochytrium polystomum]|nr:Rhodanese-like domain-containing protein [Zopfochytrium polystomum]